MALNKTRHETGFLTFGSSDPNVILSASLKSANDLPSGAVLEGADSGGVTYDSSKGINFGGTDSRLNLIGCLTTAQKAALNNGGHISFKVSKSFFDSSNVPAANKFLTYLRFTAANTYDITVMRTQTTADNKLISGWITNQAIATLSAEGRPDMLDVEIDFKWGTVRLFVDGIDVAVVDRVNAASNPLSEWDLGGRSSSFQTDEDIYYCDLQVSLRPLMLPFSFVNFAGIGDSISVASQAPSSDFAYTGYTNDDYGDSSIVASTGQLDSGVYVTAQRKLAQMGVFIPQINSYGRVSTAVASGATRPLSARTDALIDNTAGEYPAPSQRKNVTDLIALVGTNDAQLGTTASTFYTDYKTEIDRWIANGVQRIYLINIAGRTDNDYEAEIDALNAEIDTLVSEYSQCYLVDAFTALGGHNILSDKLSDGLHWTALGHYIVGKLAASVIYSALT